jgi:hypothetical protein
LYRKLKKIQKLMKLDWEEAIRYFYSSSDTTVSWDLVCKTENWNIYIWKSDFVSTNCYHKVELKQNVIFRSDMQQLPWCNQNIFENAVRQFVHLMTIKSLKNHIVRLQVDDSVWCFFIWWHLQFIRIIRTDQNAITDTLSNDFQSLYSFVFIDSQRKWTMFRPFNSCSCTWNSSKFNAFILNCKK